MFVENPAKTNTDEKLKREALRYILEAWDEALKDGIKPDMLATAALFAALSDLVTSHGEEAISAMATRLANRVGNGEFTLHRSTTH